MITSHTHSQAYVLDQDEALDFYVGKLGLEVNTDADLGFIITVDDVHKAYEDLLAKGVEFTEEPTERFYGTDCGLRDPFGNNLRMGTPKEGPIEVPSPEQLMAENS